MSLARTIVALVLLLRNKSRINVRQPLARIMLVTGTGVERAVVEKVKDVILDEVNVHTIEYIDDSSAVVRRTAKADFSRLGPRLGKRMKEAAAKIAALGDAELGRLLIEGVLALELAGGAVDIALDDVTISSEEVGEWSVAQDGAVTVALDTHITDELRMQGLAREVVNRIQNMRKACDLDLTDRIRIEYLASDRLRDSIERHAEFIRNETLALGMEQVPAPAGERVETFTIGRDTLNAGITRVAQQ